METWGSRLCLEEVRWVGQVYAHARATVIPTYYCWQVVLVSDRLAGGAAGSSLVTGGVLVFYFGVVYAIGRSIRSVLGGTRYRLTIDEMPDPRDLLDLCEGVYIARREKRLLQETELTETIFRLFRSSETLLQLTGTELKRHGE